MQVNFESSNLNDRTSGTLLKESVHLRTYQNLLFNPANWTWIHQVRYLVHEAPAAQQNPSKTLLVPVFHVKHVSEVRFLVRGHHTVQRVSFRHLADHKTPNYTEITRSHILVFYGPIGVKRDSLNDVVTSDKETDLKNVFYVKN